MTGAELAAQERELSQFSPDVVLCTDGLWRPVTFVRLFWAAVRALGGPEGGRALADLARYHPPATWDLTRGRPGGDSSLTDAWVPSEDGVSPEAQS